MASDDKRYKVMIRILLKTTIVAKGDKPCQSRIRPLFRQTIKNYNNGNKNKWNAHRQQQ